MTVYLNKALEGQYIEAHNAPDANNSSLANLKSEGFHFISFDSADNKEELDNLSKCLIENLSLKDKAELAKIISKRNGLSGAFGFRSVQEEYEYYFTQFEGDIELPSQKDFLEELVTGDEGILTGLDNILSELDIKDADFVLPYLGEILKDKNFCYWYVPGYSQGESTWVWYFSQNQPLDFDKKFEDEKNIDFYGYTWLDILQNTLYSSFVSLHICDGKEESEKVVPGFYLTELQDKDLKSNPELDEYILKKYDFKPAQVSLSFSAK